VGGGSGGPAEQAREPSRWRKARPCQVPERRGRRWGPLDGGSRAGAAVREPAVRPAGDGGGSRTVPSGAGDAVLLSCPPQVPS